MNPMYMILAIPFLAILNGFLTYYAQFLYLKAYVKHIAFEGISTSKISITRTAGQTISNLIAMLIGPLFLWAQGYSQNTGFIVLCGYIIGYLAYSLSRAAFSTIVFLYLQKYPDLVHGKATFLLSAVRMINIAAAIHELIFLGIIAFFVPAPFIIGALFGIGIITFISYFAKPTQPTI